MDSEENEPEYELGSRISALSLLNTGVVTKSQIDEIAKNGGIREEFEENWRLGFKTAWEVHQKYEVQDDMLIGSGSSTTYAPMAHKELPGEMAKLTTGNEKAVIKFARTYGTFGYHQLRTLSYGMRPSEPIKEPLSWIWGHSRTIEFCLKLTEHLQKKDETRLADYLNSSFKFEPLQNDVDWYWSNIAYRDEVVSKRWKRYKTTISLTDFARYIRMDIINRNIVGIRLEFQDVDGRDQSFFAFSALVEVAYWQLGEMLMKNERVIRCEECGASFVQTNDRQRFCPRRFHQTESACGRRARVRKHRQRK